MNQLKSRLEVTATIIHTVLSPMGFKRQKMNWRRTFPEVLQQFTVASMQLGSRYRPDWGLNLISRCEKPKPAHHELQVSWVLEQFLCPNIEGQKRGPLDEMLEIKRSFDLALPITDDQRAHVIQTFLVNYVIPCFERYQSERSVQEMMGNPGAPLRAQMFVGLPTEWWPLDQQKGIN